MKASLNRLFACASVAGLLLSGSALAVTTKIASGMHCVNSRNQEIKAATKLSECKAPYHWIKAPTVASKLKPKATIAHAKKHKGRIASTKKVIAQ